MPEKRFVPIGMLHHTIMKPTKLLHQLKSLTRFIGDSSAKKFTVENIFGKELFKNVNKPLLNLGFENEGKYKVDGDDKLAKKSYIVECIDEYGLEGVDSILDAFRSSPSSTWISLNKAKTKINIWAKNLSIFD